MKGKSIMPRYFIWTIGCQMNKAESQRIAGYLDAAGYQAAASFSDADLVVLNTCVVRQSAENKVLGTLGLLKGLKNEHKYFEYKRKYGQSCHSKSNRNPERCYQ